MKQRRFFRAENGAAAEKASLLHLPPAAQSRFSQRAYARRSITRRSSAHIQSQNKKKPAIPMGLQVSLAFPTDLDTERRIREYQWFTDLAEVNTEKSKLSAKCSRSAASKECAFSKGVSVPASTFIVTKQSGRSTMIRDL